MQHRAIPRPRATRGLTQELAQDEMNRQELMLTWKRVSLRWSVNAYDEVVGIATVGLSSRLSQDHPSCR